LARGEKVAQGSDYTVLLQKAADLVPYARNTRKHSDEQVAAIMASLVEFGFSKPILVQGTGIIAGHGTTLAALRLYEQGKRIKTPSGKELPPGYVPTLDCTGWTKAQQQAYIIADNAIAERADWDTELLKVEIGDLEAAHFNVDLLGFDPDTLGDMLYPDAGKEPGSGADGVVPDGYKSQNAVYIDCPDKPTQERIYNELTALGYECRVVSV
jgi:hypothetical protein